MIDMILHPKGNLTSETKRAICEILFQGCCDGVLERGVFSRVVKLFSVYAVDMCLEYGLKEMIFVEQVV